MKNEWDISDGLKIRLCLCDTRHPSRRPATTTPGQPPQPAAVEKLFLPPLSLRPLQQPLPPSPASPPHSHLHHIYTTAATLYTTPSTAEPSHHHQQHHLVTHHNRRCHHHAPTPSSLPRRPRHHNHHDKGAFYFDSHPRVRLAVISTERVRLDLDSAQG
nr:hypothetical protein [Tanacetum cinerariifolium]